MKNRFFNILMIIILYSIVIPYSLFASPVQMESVPAVEKAFEMDMDETDMERLIDMLKVRLSRYNLIESYDYNTKTTNLGSDDGLIIYDLLDDTVLEWDKGQYYLGYSLNIIFNENKVYASAKIKTHQYSDRFASVSSFEDIDIPNVAIQYFTDYINGNVMIPIALCISALEAERAEVEFKREMANFGWF